MRKVSVESHPSQQDIFTGPLGVCNIRMDRCNDYFSLFESQFFSRLRAGGQKVKIREKLLTASSSLGKEVRLQLDVIDGIEPGGWGIDNLRCQKVTSFGPKLVFFTRDLIFMLRLT